MTALNAGNGYNTHTDLWNTFQRQSYDHFSRRMALTRYHLGRITSASFFFRPFTCENLNFGYHLTQFQSHTAQIFPLTGRIKAAHRENWMSFQPSGDLSRPYGAKLRNSEKQLITHDVSVGYASFYVFEFRRGQ
jgi:hypothetical protein